MTEKRVYEVGYRGTFSAPTRIVNIYIKDDQIDEEYYFANRHCLKACEMSTVASESFNYKAALTIYCNSDSVDVLFSFLEAEGWVINHLIETQRL
jgi:hypothetical protein